MIDWLIDWLINWLIDWATTNLKLQVPIRNGTLDLRTSLSDVLPLSHRDSVVSRVSTFPQSELVNIYLSFHVCTFIYHVFLVLFFFFFFLFIYLFFLIKVFLWYFSQSCQTRPRSRRLVGLFLQIWIATWNRGLFYFDFSCQLRKCLIDKINAFYSFMFL